MCNYDQELDERKLTIVSLNDFIKSTTIEDYELVPLQKKIFENGELVYEDPSLLEKREYLENQMNRIYPEVKRLLNPHGYYVDGSEEYANFKNEMIRKYRKK